MKSPLRAVIFAACLPLAAACDDYHYRFFGAVDPTPVRPIAASPGGNWRADATVVLGSARGCGWGTTLGETHAAVPWNITLGPGAILLEQGLQTTLTDRVPFSGTLNGQEFSATNSNGGNYLASGCQFRGGTLTGRFSPDFSTFEAVETLTFGPTGDTRVQRRWVGSRF